jgi:predicted transcriptional regulator
LPPSLVSSKVVALNLEHASVLCSIHPIYANKIMGGSKLVELRRRFPMNESLKNMIVYATSPIKCIIGEVEIKKIKRLPIREMWSIYSSVAGISKEDYFKYFSGREDGFAIELSKPRIYARSIPLALMNRLGIQPPQAYRYLNWPEMQDKLEYIS